MLKALQHLNSSIASEYNARLTASCVHYFRHFHHPTLASVSQNLLLLHIVHQKQPLFLNYCNALWPYTFICITRLSPIIAGFKDDPGFASRVACADIRHIVDSSSTAPYARLAAISRHVRLRRWRFLNAAWPRTGDRFADTITIAVVVNRPDIS
jgi:hypothetical protein